MPEIQTRDAIEDVWGPRTGYYEHWPSRVDYRCTEEPEKWVQSACVMCSNGCGMDLGVKDGKIVGVRGREVDRVNKGRLGPKGLYSWAANASPDRLTTPLIRKDGKLVSASWDEAMELIVRKTKESMEKLSNHSIGFYTTGQLYLEEYYTLAVIGKAGLNTLHMDGNTRLCTATAATSMRESFGSDGQPGSYTDIDVTDCILMVGHNMANTQTVLWTRILDRLAGPKPPTLIVVDPRKSESAKKATYHMAPRIGTNMAFLNGLQRLLLPYVDHDFVTKHTVGFEQLKQTVSKYTPEFVEEITGIPASQLKEVAEVIGKSKSLLSTCLQGVYQSNQATASACQVNNINLILGRIGKPGCGIFQMNGQPTAQNNRETGCDGEFPAFRNNKNTRHMQELADLWNIDYQKVPHWGQPTHIMSMLHHIEEGSISVFWIIATNPLVSLPDLERIRKLFTKKDLFVIVQDIFMTETAEIADVVLPGSASGEKTGCFTNVDRTVHISHKAVEPPGQAKSDLEIFIDFAKRMEFKNKEGEPLVWWNTPNEAFTAWQKCSEGRPCDYSGMSYEKLSEGSGIQWPCNKENPDGKERLFTDGKFFTDIDVCESFGHDLETGAPLNRDQYLQMSPAGRAILKTAEYRQSEEMPSDEYPLSLSTGRNVYHFHTRTKTGRIPQLQKARPNAVVQISAIDAEQYGIKDGEDVIVSSRRGKVQVPARVGEIEPGQIFIPFHYGYWDDAEKARAANELTTDTWDFISKQPVFKSGAVKVEPAGVEIHGVHRPKIPNKQTPNTERKVRLLESFIEKLGVDLVTLTELYSRLREKEKNYELREGMHVLQDITNNMQARLQPIFTKYNVAEKIQKAEPQLDSPDSDVLSMLQYIFVHLSQVQAHIIVLTPTAGAMWDAEFVETVGFCEKEVGRQISWARNEMSVRSPQTLIVPKV